MIVRAPNVMKSEEVVRQASSPEEAIERWLGLLLRMMKLPDAKREAVRDELSEHLHDRARDLMLAGKNETDAVRTAIEELGEAADLARRLEAANSPDRRRLWMNLAMLGLGAAVVTLGVVSVTSPRASVQRSVFEGSDHSAAPPASFDVGAERIDAGMPLADVLRSLAEAADTALVVRWGELGDYGIDQASEVMTDIDGVSVRQALDLVVDAFDEHGIVGWSYRDGAIEVGLRDPMDRRETLLVSYDVTAVVGQGYEEPMRDVILNLVEPDAWMDNGGDLAQLHVVGSRMFVEAPRRMHERIEWILAELTPSEEMVLGPGFGPEQFTGGGALGRGFGPEDFTGASRLGSGLQSGASGGAGFGASTAGGGAASRFSGSGGN